MTENKESVNLLVKIDGSEQIKATDTDDWSTMNGMHVVSLTVDMRLDCPDSFELQVMGSQEGRLTAYDFAKEGSEVELGFGYHGKPDAMFKGEVVYCEVEFDATEGAFVTLRGYGPDHRLTRGHSAKTWGDGINKDQIVSDIVSEVIQNSKAEKGEASDGLSTDQVDKTEFESVYIPKAMGSDYEFIKWAGGNLARASDGNPTDAKKVSFRKLDVNQSPVATCCYDKPQGEKDLRVIRCRHTISTFPSFSKVRVHGWNIKDKKAFVGEIEECSSEVDCSSANSGWTSGWKAAGKAHYGSEGSGAIYERVMEYCETKEEAEKIAQGLFDRFSLNYLTGEAQVEGCSDIVPGTIVEFKGFGERVSGKVLVTAATHRLDAKGTPYTTSFQFCSNAAGASKG